MFINDTGQIKTACLYSWPGERSNYEKGLLMGRVTYLAPEEVV